MPLKFKTEKEFNRWKNKKTIKGNTPIRKKRPISKSDLTKIADELVKEITLKNADFKCFCGKTAITNHHIVPRSQSFLLRHDLKNNIAICISCHFAWHTKNDPFILTAIITAQNKKYGEDWWEYLEKIRRTINSSCKTIKYLKNKIEELNNF